MKQGFYLGLDVGQVRILPHTVPSGVIADAVEGFCLLGCPASGNVRKDVERHEEGTLKIGIYAFDGIFRVIHLDYPSDEALVT